MATRWATTSTYNHISTLVDPAVGGSVLTVTDAYDRPVTVAEYDERHDRLLFTHTEVEPGREGKGLAGNLVRQALDDARTNERQVVPLCSYVRSWIDRHPAYGDLVDRDLTDRYLADAEG